MIVSKIKRLKFTFYNSFTGDEYCVATFPYMRMKSVNKWYSKWVKRMYKVQCEIYNCPIRHMKFKLEKF